jgi:hypothetical protein
MYKTECLFVRIFCMQIYSFTPILMKFCTLDLQNKKKITVKKKRQFFRVGNTLTFAASPLFHPLSISSPSPLDTHKKQPLLSFLSLLSTKTVFSSWKSRLHDMFSCHSYIWLFIKVAISQNVFE